MRWMKWIILKPFFFSENLVNCIICLLFYCLFLYFLIDKLFDLFCFAVGTKFPASKLKEQEVNAYWEIERLEMHKILDKYLLLCLQKGVLISSCTLVYAVVLEFQLVLEEFVILTKKKQFSSTLINNDYEFMMAICMIVHQDLE